MTPLRGVGADRVVRPYGRFHKAADRVVRPYGRFHKAAGRVVCPYFSLRSLFSSDMKVLMSLNWR